jgi:hypothetical protein
MIGLSPQLQGEYDLRKSLGPLYSKIIFTEKTLDAYDLEDLQNMVVALQLEFPSIYAYRESQGYSARCEVEGTCVRVLARLGQFSVPVNKASFVLVSCRRVFHTR